MPTDGLEPLSGRKREGNYSPVFTEKQDHVCWEGHGERR